MLSELDEILNNLRTSSNEKTIKRTRRELSMARA